MLKKYRASKNQPKEDQEFLNPQLKLTFFFFFFFFWASDSLNLIKKNQLISESGNNNRNLSTTSNDFSYFYSKLRVFTKSYFFYFFQLWIVVLSLNWKIKQMQGLVHTSHNIFRSCITIGTHYPSRYMGLITLWPCFCKPEIR